MLLYVKILNFQKISIINQLHVYVLQNILLSVTLKYFCKHMKFVFIPVNIYFASVFMEFSKHVPYELRVWVLNLFQKISYFNPLANVEVWTDTIVGL